MREDSGERDTGASRAQAGGLLPRQLCQVVGLNQNYTSRVGTGYHIQVEDRGPVFDEATEAWVRRVNTIAYANYGEPTARIIWGRDEDFPDLRTQEHNRFIEGKIQEAAEAARALLELREQRQTARIKSLLLHYHQSRGEEAKAEFEEANRLYPFVFARAWHELKGERPPTAVPAAPEPPEPEIDETIYPLDPSQRELVLEIERVREELEKDLAELKRSGAADDILLATCAKILYRAHESLTQRAATGSDFAARRLEMTKNSLVTTYRQVRARLTRQRAETAPRGAR
ncbi:MAG: hypothetical protein LJF30_04765 [Acidobacteria bacterium]|nr:hypothetical protein [Acidobacteriota bacterium]